jgi:hypothetical protein
VTIKAPVTGPFQVHICKSGYLLAAVPATADTPSVRSLTVRKPEIGRQVSLPEDAYVSFATACTSADDVLRFANRYGFLGCDDYVEKVQDVVELYDDEGNGLGNRHCEAIDTWLEHAKFLRWCWQYWQDLGTKNADVRDRCQWLLTHAPIFLEPPPGHLHPDSMAPQTRRLKTRDTPAMLFVDSGNTVGIEWETACEAMSAHEEKRLAKDTARKGLSEAQETYTHAKRESRLSQKHRSALKTATAQLKDAQTKLRSADSIQRQRVRAIAWTLLRLTVTERLRTLHVVPVLTALSQPTTHRSRKITTVPTGLLFEAPTLLSALWLQFAIAISKQVRYRRCRGCNTFLTIHSDAYRTNRRTCSDACRQKVSRSRRRRKPSARRPRP